MGKSVLSRDIPWPTESRIHYPESEEFSAATLRWSIYKAPTFSAAVTPPDEGTLAKIVRVARAENISFLATAGRHGYGTALGNLKGGLAIDLSELKFIEIDRAAATVTVGAGVRIGDAIGPIHEAGFELPIGSCPGVGLIGATLGGGIGVLQGLFGLIIDSLISVRIVTADGVLTEASEKLNPDLFWAVRGAGFNFGIVTSATYKLHKAVNNGEIMTADVIFPANMKSAYFETLESFEKKMPPELAVSSVIVWDVASNTTQIIATFIYSGPEPRGREVLAPFLELNPPVVRISVDPYSKFLGTIVFGMISVMNTPGGIHSIFSANIRKCPADTLNSIFDKFDAFFQAHPGGRTSAAVLETFSTQAMAAVPDDATAYPWRDARGNLMLQMSWQGLGDPIEETANDLARSIRRDVVANSGYPDLSVYVSYAFGDETPEQIYGKEKLPRLRALKKKWDPENVFRYNNSLPVD